MQHAKSDKLSRMAVQAMERQFLTSDAGEPFRQPYEEIEAAYTAAEAKRDEFWERAKPMFEQFLIDHGGGED